MKQGENMVKTFDPEALWSSTFLPDGAIFDFLDLAKRRHKHSGLLDPVEQIVDAEDIAPILAQTRQRIECHMKTIENRGASGLLRRFSQPLSCQSFQRAS